MRMLSEFIRDLKALKSKHGDLPVVKADSSGAPETIPDDDAVCDFWEKGAWDSENQKQVDCIVIL